MVAHTLRHSHTYKHTHRCRHTQPDSVTQREAVKWTLQTENPNKNNNYYSSSSGSGKRRAAMRMTLFVCICVVTHTRTEWIQHCKAHTTTNEHASAIIINAIIPLESLFRSLLPLCPSLPCFLLAVYAIFIFNFHCFVYSNWTTITTTTAMRIGASSELSDF